LEMRGLMGGLYRLTEWVMRLSFINLLWLAFSLFIPFFLLLVLYGVDPAEAPEGFYVLPILIVCVLAPFTMFPATSAMFTIVRKFVQGADDAPIFKTFFKGFKENYVKSMLGGLFFVILYVVIYYNYTFYTGQDGALKTLGFVFLFLTVLVIITNFHFFNFIVHLDLKFGKLLKNAALMTIGSPIISLGILGANLVILYVSYFKITFLVPFFTGSLMAFCTYWFYQRSFNRIVEKAQASAEASAVKEDESEEEETSSNDSARSDRP